MSADTRGYEEATHLTVISLRKFVDTTDQLTYLSLPLQERNALIDEIAKVIPAGNIPTLVTAALANLRERVVPINESRRNVALLIQGMQTFLDQAAFRTLFEGPARVLSAYQMILKLTGKDLEQSFPEGTWQFYVEFGLREDSSRHACETIGFQRALNEQNLDLDSADQLATWIAASTWLLENYPGLLENEWHEHSYLKHLAQVLDDSTLIDRWLKIRPYSVPAIPGLNALNLVEYRRRDFASFCAEALADTRRNVRQRAESAWNAPVAVAQRVAALAAYQRQLSIQAALQPGEHSDTRVPIQDTDLRIAVIAAGRYYLIDFNTARDPARFNDLRRWCAGILRDKVLMPAATLDHSLIAVPRHEQAGLRRALTAYDQREVECLRAAPIIINWDVTRSDTSLTEIRSGRRGIGDHALTIFRGSDSMVFDMSHIFFDGPWGMAVAEILTGQAIRQIQCVSKADTVIPVSSPPHLALQGQAPVRRSMSITSIREVSGETTQARFEAIREVRRNLQARNQDLRLTVNDLLILFRSLFGPLYQPSPDLLQSLNMLDGDGVTHEAAQLARNAIEVARQPNPSLLIPVDAMRVNPRDRIFPLTFRNPLIDIYQQHQRALTAFKTLDANEAANRDSSSLEISEARAARKDYLTTISAFGLLLARYKAVSLQGESVSTASIKLLAGLPTPLQKLLDSYTVHFDLLNDAIKGQEVFSNVGRVSIQSSLTRFHTAKDDNEKKTLAWGIMTDANGVLRISLRDFRPHVTALANVHQEPFARQMTQDYLDAYAQSLNTYLEELLFITRARPRLK